MSERTAHARDLLPARWIRLITLIGVLLVLSRLATMVVSNRGSIALMTGDFVQAELLLDGICHDACLPYIRGGLMKVYVAKDNLMAAQALAGRMNSATDSVTFTWLIRSAEHFTEVGNNQQAISLLDLLSQYSQVEAADFWYRIGQAYEEAGDSKQARRSYLTGIALDPKGDLALGWFYLSQLYVRSQDWQAVVDTLSPILGRQPDIPPKEWPWPRWQEAFYWWSTSLRSLGRRAEAYDVALRAVRQNSQRSDWLMQLLQIELGDYELEQGQYALALGRYLRSYEIALGIHGRARYDYEKMAWSGFQRYAQAASRAGFSATTLAAIEVELESSPEKKELFVILGAINEILCNRSAALRAYQNALALIPDSEFLNDRISMIPEKSVSCP